MSPSGSANTIWPLTPPWAGKRWSSRSMPRWASVPGMVKLSLGSPPTAERRTTTASTTTSHAPTIRQGWRAADRPQRYRTWDMVVPPGPRPDRVAAASSAPALTRTLPVADQRRSGPAASDRRSAAGGDRVLCGLDGSAGDGVQVAPAPDREGHGERLVADRGPGPSFGAVDVEALGRGHRAPGPPPQRVGQAEEPRRVLGRRHVPDRR